MSVAKYRETAAARLLRKARTQLPDDRVSAVFIALEGFAAAKRKLETLLAQDIYANTPWVSIWRGEEVACAVWRNNQPFDARLLEPMALEC